MPAKLISKATFVAKAPNFWNFLPLLKLMVLDWDQNDLKTLDFNAGQRYKQRKNLS